MICLALTADAVASGCATIDKRADSGVVNQQYDHGRVSEPDHDSSAQPHAHAQSSTHTASAKADTSTGSRAATPANDHTTKADSNHGDSIRQETQALYMVAVTHARAKEYPQAIAAMKQATTMVPDSPFLKAELVQLLVEAGDYHEAMSTAKSALSQHPRSVLLLLTFAAVAVDMRHTEEAIAACQRATQIAPDNSDPYRMLAWLQQRDDQREAAHETLRAWSSAIPKEPEAWFQLGELFLQVGNNEEAIAHYRKALQLDPTHLNANYQLGRIFKAEGELDKAITHYRVVFQYAPGNMNAGLTLARLLLAAGNEAEGAGVLESVRSIFNSDPGIDFVVVEMLIEFNLTKRAIQIASERLNSDPSLLEAELLIAKALHKAGHIQEALEHLSKLGSNGPAGAQGAMLTARIAIENQNAPDKALLLLKEALKIIPENSEAWELSGDAYIVLAEKQKAAACFKKAIEFAPDKEQKATLTAKLHKTGVHIQTTDVM